MTCYMICPYAGGVCTKCNVRVLPIDGYGYTRGILKHETKANGSVHKQENHTAVSDYASRKSFDELVDATFRSLARRLVFENAEPEYELRQYIQERPEPFFVCSDTECNGKLFYKKQNHRSHYSFLSQVHRYIPKHWTKASPKPILDPFDINVKDNFCPQFWEHLQRARLELERERQQLAVAANTFELPQPAPTVQTPTVVTLRDKMIQKLSELDRVDTDVAVPQQSIKETNTWVRRVGWEHHLKNKNLGYLLSLSTPVKDEEVSLLKFLTIFDLLVRSSIDLFNEKTQPSSPVRFHMNRNEKSTNQTKPFELVDDETWTRYIDVMQRFVVVLVRMATKPEEETSQLPSFVWYESQESVLLDFLQYIEAEPMEGNGVLKCLNVVVSWFNQPILADAYHCISLSVLSVLGLRSDATFEPPEVSTRKFAAVFKIMKLLVFRKSYEEDVESNGNDPCKSQLLRILNGHMDRFMVYDPILCSPITWMYSVFNYAKAISSNEFNLPRISWLDDGVTVYCDDVGLNIEQLRSKVIPCTIVEMERSMKSLLFLEHGSLDDAPSIPALIHDDPNNCSRNYSFLNHNANHTWVQKGSNYLLDRMDPSWLEENSVGFDVAKFNLYEANRVHFLKLLLFTIHVTSGQPGRGTEVVDIRYANTGTRRNLFYDKESSMLFTWTRYHKSYNQKNVEKHICRFLPKAVTRLVIQYLWIVLPFSKALHSILTDKNVPSNYLFALQTTVSTLEHQHVGVFTSKFLTNILCETFYKYVNAKITINNWRHMAIAMVEFKIRNVQKLSNDDFGDDDDDVWDYQCAHNPSVAKNHYANDKSLPDIGVTSFASFRRISQRWHQFLGLAHDDGKYDSRNHTGTANVDETAQFQNILQRNRHLRLDGLLDKFDAITTLRKYMNDDKASFRGKQRQVLHAIINQRPNILHVAGTGEGKSLSFLLIGYHNTGGTTVVVTPLIALKEDFIARCHERNVTAKVWPDDSSNFVPYQSVAIIFVTPESSVSERFKSLVDFLKKSSLLDRIVFDECHMYLECTPEFRDRMGAIGEYYNEDFGIQRIYLTATLPPILEDDLFRQMRIRRCDLSIIRSSTRRHNISYNVRTVNTYEYCIRTIRDEIDKLGDGGHKVIVFCRTVEELVKVSTDLRCYMYHHHLADKQIQFRRWKDSTSSSVQVIAATSSLGAGIDIPNVRLVIMFGPPQTLTELIQAAGRSGRDGNYSRALVFDYNRMLFKLDSSVTEFLQCNGCRRIPIDRYLDGNTDVSHVCNFNNTNETLCDYCESTRIDYFGDIGDDFWEAFDDDLGPNTPAIHQLGDVTVDNCHITPFRPSPEIRRRHVTFPSATPTVTTGQTPTLKPRDPAMKRYVTPQSRTTTISETPETQLPEKTIYNNSTDYDAVNDCHVLLQRFKGKCFLCVLDNQTYPSPCFFKCNRHDRTLQIAVKDRMIKYRSEIMNRKLMPLYHGCSKSGCYLPQSWCPTWEISMTSAAEGVRYRKLPTENCLFRNVLLGTIIACSIICRRCKELYVQNKFEDVERQMASITWGNEATIRLWHTFYEIFSCYLNQKSGKRQRV